MKQPLPAAFALVCLATSTLAFAGGQTFPAPNFAVSGPQATSSPKAAGASIAPGTPMANAYRSYPPSCAAYPLPDKPSGPAYSGVAAALANPMLDSNNAWVFTATENLTVTVWRLPCSSSGASVPYNNAGAKNAMTLVRIDRADDSATATTPIMPQILVFQGDVTSSNFDPRKNIRLASEPNTVLSDRKYGSAYDMFTTSTTFVLENRSSADAAHFNFNAAFTLQMNAGYGSVSGSVPAYAPAADTYPDASSPIALDGYAAAQYYNPERNEGLLVQVAEGYDSNNPKRRQLVLDLLTEDTANNPFWIVGAAAFDPVAGGVRGLDVPVTYLVQGNSSLAWGSIHVAMTSCNQMSLTFTPVADLPANVPSITGTVAYARLLSANGMSCE